MTSVGSQSKCNGENKGQLVINSPLNDQIQRGRNLKYHQLSEQERYQIQAGIHVGMRLFEIATQLKRHRTTIFRELKRNGHISREGYAALYAQSQYKDRRKKSRRRFLVCGELKRWIDFRIQFQWSPEQIAGRRKLEQLSPVGVETIYRYLYRDKLTGGTLWRHLRHSTGKRKKRFISHRWPLALPRPTIFQRPDVINNRQRIGDYERDVVVGKQRQGNIITLVERKSRFCRLKKLPYLTSRIAHEASVELLKGLSPLSITNDNGMEFARYQETAKELNTAIYFTRPYASWERGTVENTNKLIRQYFPKTTNFLEVCDEKIKMVETLLNHRPRKTLGFRSPIETIAERESISNVALD